MKDTIITSQYLEEHPNEIFVFGDNLKRVGTGGAAKLRHHKNVYGFITKKAPTHYKKDYYKPREYMPVFWEEYWKLKDEILNNPKKTYLISRLGGGLANKYNIYEEIICRFIRGLELNANVKFLYKEGESTCNIV